MLWKAPPVGLIYNIHSSVGVARLGSSLRPNLLEMVSLVVVGLELGLELDHIHFGGRLSLELRLQASYCLGAVTGPEDRVGFHLTLWV